MPTDERARLLNNSLMMLKKLHPEIMPWQMRMLEQVRHPEILGIFAGLVDFRKAASRWLTKAIAAVDKDYDNPSGPVRIWFKSRRPTPYEVIKGLLPKPKPPEPPKKKEPAAPAAAAPAPAPAPVPVPEAAPASDPAPAAEEPKAEKKKPARKRKVKPASE